MTESNPEKVSVVIAAYNAEKYIGEAVESVLDQSVRPFQVIVVNDGSTDGTRIAVRRFGRSVELYEQPNSGAASARNAGIRHAAGEFLAFLDSDDLWEPLKLEKQLAVFRRIPETGSVYCHVRNFYSPDMNEEKRKRFAVPEQPMLGYIPGALLIRRNDFLRAGYFKPGVSMGDFLEWLLRAREAKVSEAILPDVLVKRRIHGQNLTLRNPASDYLPLLREAIKRRQGACPLE